MRFAIYVLIEIINYTLQVPLGKMSGKRVADYFIVAGLPEERKPLENTNEQKASSRSEPITDICVVIPSEGEECPPG